jgi:hypothetical protein
MAGFGETISEFLGRLRGRGKGAVAVPLGMSPFPTRAGGARQVDLGGGDRLDWALKHRTGDSDRGTRYALRAMTFIAVLLGYAVALQSTAFSNLLPLKRDVPYFLEDYREERSVVNVRTMGRDVQSRREVEKREVARYVRILYEVIPDKSEQDRRWGPSCAASKQSIDYTDDIDLLCSYIFVRSSQLAWRKVETQVHVAKTFIEGGKARTVRIIGDPIRRDDGLWETRVEATEWKDLGEPSNADPKRGPWDRIVDKKGRVDRVYRKVFLLRAGSVQDRPTESIQFRLNPDNFIVQDIVDVVDMPG